MLPDHIKPKLTLYYRIMCSYQHQIKYNKTVLRINLNILRTFKKNGRVYSMGETREKGWYPVDEKTDFQLFFSLVFPTSFSPSKSWTFCRLIKFLWSKRTFGKLMIQVGQFSARKCLTTPAKWRGKKISCHSLENDCFLFLRSPFWRFLSRIKKINEIRKREESL